MKPTNSREPEAIGEELVDKTDKLEGARGKWRGVSMKPTNFSDKDST